MKTIKTFHLTLVMLVLSVLAGCSDKFMSPSATTPTTNIKGASNSEESSIKNVYQSKIKLAPGQTYTFNYDNTGFYTFDLVLVSNCLESRKNLEIVGKGDDYLLLLHCNSKGFFAKSIQVRNLSSGRMELDVTLSGSKKKINDSGSQIIDSE